MKIILNKGVLKKDAINVINKLIFDSGSLTEFEGWKNYKKILYWKVEVESEIKRIFSNFGDIIIELFEMGEFENPDLISSALEYLNPIDFKSVEHIQKRNRELLYRQIKILKDIKNQLEDSNDEVKKVKLSEQNISFNEKTGIIMIGKEPVQLPAFKNEYYFCKIMFENSPKEPIDWSIIYDKMENITHGETEYTSKNKRTLRDTMYALNKRVMKKINTDNKLFEWKNKAIKRLF